MDHSAARPAHRTLRPAATEAVRDPLAPWPNALRRTGRRGAPLRAAGPAAALAAQAAEAARMLNLIGNPHRLLMIAHLAARGEMKVGELVDVLGLSQSALSQHLTKLRKGGLVTFRRAAQVLHYRIADPSVVPLIRSLGIGVPKT